jgi:hypothetical protein
MSVDDRAALIAEFILKHAAPDVEFEFRVGVLEQGGMRVALPVRNDVALDAAHHHQFKTGVPQTCSAAIHDALKAQVNAGAMTEARSVELDQIYNAGAAGELRLTTRKLPAPKVKRVIRKTPLATLDFFSPQNALDFRLSAAREKHEPSSVLPAPPAAPIEIREKDRASYASPGVPWRFDITTVTTWESRHLPGHETWEAELECDGAAALAAAAAAEAGNYAPLLDIAASALTNVRFVLGVCTSVVAASGGRAVQ